MWHDFPVEVEKDQCVRVCFQISCFDVLCEATFILMLFEKVSQVK